MTNSQQQASGEFGEYDSEPDERGTIHQQAGEGDHGKKKWNSQDRIKLLAQHKEPHIAQHTCIRPDVKWGTQDMLWPVSVDAMNGSATSRVQTLATPKKNFRAGSVYESRPLYYYSVGRPSVIWSISEGAKTAQSADRLQYLSQHKKFHPGWSEDKSQYYFSCGRESPMWEIQRGTRQCEERPRTTTLAGYKAYHPDFQDERPIQSIVTEAALSAIASDRVSGLAKAKKHRGGQFRDPQWPVSEQTRSAVASGRCMELAATKPLAEGFQLAKPIEWPVSNAAKHASSSPRVEELARPVTRATTDNLQFNPDAFFVKQSALKGIIPGRIQELAQPVNR